MSHNPAWLINKYPKDLKAQIKELVERGYTVTVQDKTSAQLVRKKEFSCLIGLLSFFFFGIGFFLYLIYFLAQKDSIVYLDIKNQELDPDWEKKEKLARQKYAVRVAIVFGAIIAAFILFVSLPLFLADMGV